MSDEHDLEQAFIGAVNSLTRHFVVVDGTVSAVDADPTDPERSYTCDVQLGGDPNGAILYSVPLRVLKGSQAWMIEVPVIGSDCLVTFRDGNLGRPQMYEIDQVQDIFLINKGDFNINPGGKTIFNGGKQAGTPLVIPLAEAISKIQNDVNTLKNAFNSWIVVPNDGGAALKAAAGAWAGQALPVTQQSDIENKNIVQ